MNPMDPIRDTMAWPVQPVPAVLATRHTRDLEPGSSQQGEPSLTTDQGEDSVEQDFTRLSRGARRPRIGELMTRDVVAIESHRSLPELQALLQQHQISGVPVIEADSGNLVGVVSQSDIVRHLSEQPTAAPASYHDTIWFDIMMPNLSTDSVQVRVSEIMTPFIHFATEDATVAEVLDVMLAHHIHRIVITKEHRLTGVVTSLDLLRRYRKELA